MRGLHKGGTMNTHGPRPLRRAAALSLLGLFVTLACERAENAPPPPPTQVAAASPDQASAASEISAPPAGSLDHVPPNSDPPDLHAVPAPNAPGPAEHDASIAAPAAGLPGEVCKVLQDNGCITCHQTPTLAGAPMALQWRSDLTGKTRDGSSLAATLLARVQDTRAPMPPPTSMRPRMPADQVA